MSYDQYKRNLNILNLRPCQARTVEDIKVAYRKLVLKHHPDHFKTQVNKAKATENFKRITKAYEEVLTDFEKYQYFEEPKKEKQQKATKSDIIVNPKQEKKKKREHKYAPTTYKTRLDFDTLFEICFEGVAI